MDKLLTAQQVADVLGLHVKTLQKRLRQNEISLTFVRVSQRKIGFKPAEVARYMDLNEIRRDGGGIKKSRPNWKSAKKFLTDEEAQAFFEGVERDSEGVLLAGNAEK